MGELRMPVLGADMTAGRLLEWHVGPGDAIRRGDVVATVDTDKAEIDIESFQDGVVQELVVAPGTKVPVGTVLATVAGPAEEGGVEPAAAPTGAPEPPRTTEAGPPPPPHEAPRPAPPERPEPPPGRPRVSPLARRVAAELGVDPAAVAGTGPGGAVTRADVEAAAADAAADADANAGARASGPAAEEDATPGPAARRPAEDRRASLIAAVGRLMERSKREIPHYAVQRTLDLSIALDWLAERNRAARPDERVLPAALLLRAVAGAARDVPGVNGTYEDGRFRPASAVSLGVAVSLRGGGIIAPVIPDADGLGLDDLMGALRGVTGRARRGSLRASDLGVASLTVTNLGDRGADLVDGVIFPPQVALVGFGRIAERPVAVDGLVGARPTVIATLAGDHRVSDGHVGSRFLGAVDRLLREPETL